MRKYQDDRPVLAYDVNSRINHILQSLCIRSAV